MAPAEVVLDRRVDPERPADSPRFHWNAWLDRFAWPVTVLFALYMVGTSYVYFRYGPERTQQWLDFMTGPAFIAALGLVAAAGVTVVRRVRQLAKSEMWSAAAASNSAGAKEEALLTRKEMKALVEEVLTAVKSQSATAPREPDPNTDEIVAVVKDLANRMTRIEANTAAAASSSRGAQETVVGYGGVLREFATAVSAATGPTPAQRPAEPAPEPEWPGSRYGRPEARSEAQEAYEDWSRRAGSHRATTTQQSAVPPAPAPQAADEHEDWQELDDEGDDGPGLPTSQIRGFRTDMARADAEERAARDQPPARQPWTPRFPPGQPTVVPAWQPQPAADPAEEQSRQQRARRWTNPEEGN